MLTWTKNRLAGLGFFLGFMLDPGIRRRPAIMRGYVKIRFCKLLTPGRTKPLKLVGFRVHYGSLAFLHSIYKEIFMERLYAFDAKNTRPRILDAGANIGLATLFYKYCYPEAEIECFEPDPKNCELLKRNIQENKLTKVGVHELALSDRAGTITFYTLKSAASGGDIGGGTNLDLRRSSHAKSDIAKTTVPCAPLSNYLKQPADLLKIDIEGAEGQVLAAAGPALKKISRIQMEFHYQAKSNPLDGMVRTLEDADFTFTMQPVGPFGNIANSLAIIYAERSS